MKKKIATILAAVLCIATLVGCGSAIPANGTQENINDTQTVTGELASAQKTPTDINYSLERYNLIRRAYWVNLFAKWTSLWDTSYCLPEMLWWAALWLTARCPA